MTRNLGYYGTELRGDVHVRFEIPADAAARWRDSLASAARREYPDFPTDVPARMLAWRDTCKALGIEEPAVTAQTTGKVLERVRKREAAGGCAPGTTEQLRAALEAAGLLA